MSLAFEKAGGGNCGNARGHFKLLHFSKLHNVSRTTLTPSCQRRLASRFLDSTFQKESWGPACAGVTEIGLGCVNNKCHTFFVLLNQSRRRQKILLELRNIVQSRLGILLAGDGKVELVLLLGQQFKKLWNVPHIFLPI